MAADDGPAQRQPPARISGDSCRSNDTITFAGSPTPSRAAALSALFSPDPCTIFSTIIRLTAPAASPPPISASASKAAVCSATGCSSPKPRKRRQSASKATTALTSCLLPASLAGAPIDRNPLIGLGEHISQLIAKPPVADAKIIQEAELPRPTRWFAQRTTQN